jgi:HPt (histidine-containing phosphotransfer) domain-containing protein
MLERNNREAYERAEETLRSEREKQGQRISERLSAPGIEKLAVITYHHLTGALDYLRGDSISQTMRKLEDLKSQAHGESLELNRRHEILMAEVARLSSALEEAINELKGFEEKVLRTQQEFPSGS